MRLIALLVVLSIGGCSLLVDTTGFDTNPSKPSPDGGSSDGGHANDGGGTTTNPDGAPPPPPSSPPVADNECQGDYLFCNPFETDQDVGDWSKSNISAVLDTKTFRRGKSAVRLHIDDPFAGNAVFTYSGTAALPQHVFLRTMVKSDALGGALLYRGRGDYVDGVQVYVGGDGAYHLGHYKGGDQFTNIFPETASWHCVEMEVDEVDRVARAWFDGSDAFEIALDGYVGPYDIVSIGVNADAVAAWYDELIASTKRIGCP